MKKTVYPLRDHIIIKADAAETTTDFGIVIQSAAGVGDSRSATVIAVGPDVKDIKPGYTVYVMWTKALPVRIDGEDCSFCKVEDIVAIIDNEP